MISWSQVCFLSTHTQTLLPSYNVNHFGFDMGNSKIPPCIYCKFSCLRKTVWYIHSFSYRLRYKSSNKTTKSTVTECVINEFFIGNNEHISDIKGWWRRAAEKIRRIRYVRWVKVVSVDHISSFLENECTFWHSIDLLVKSIGIPIYVCVSVRWLYCVR